MGSKYEVRLSDGVSYRFNDWWSYIKFRLKNRGQVLYIRVNYF